MRRIRVTAIHNRTLPPVEVRYPTGDGTALTIPPGETSTGSWLIRYNPFEHPELDDVPSPVELWFTGSPTEFSWGSIAFQNGRLQVGDYVRIYDELEDGYQP